jgi:hypothetical protein
VGPSTARWLRRAVVIAGGGVIAAAPLLELAGIGRPGLGPAQVLAMIAGAALVAAGIAGQRTVTIYRAVAILLLNTLALIVLVEFAVRAGELVDSQIGKREPSSSLISGTEAEPLQYLHSVPRRASLPYYQAQAWGQDYWQTMDDYTGHGTVAVYVPYVIWRSPPVRSATLNIGQDLRRVTPGAACDSPDAFRVVVLGGSTIWGFGAPDWGTIPAYLQQTLAGMVDRPVCVENLADQAHLVTQNVITLMLELERGHVPDMVIFYNGVNEVMAAQMNGDPMAHWWLGPALRLSTSPAPQESPLDWLRDHLETVDVLAKTLDIQRPAPPGVPAIGPEFPAMTAEEIDLLADETVMTTLNAYRQVAAWGDAYGFEYCFFWQPILPVGDKPLTIEEQEMAGEMSSLSPTLPALIAATYNRMAQVIPDETRLYDLTDVLDAQSGQVWIDFMHITPEGNALVAAAMLDVIAPDLSQKSENQP